MHVDNLKKSNYLTKGDCGSTGILLTIRELVEENIAKDGAAEDLKFCLYFEECEKPLVCNPTNGQLIASITGQSDTDNWPGHKVVLYNEPSVSFAGKVTGGIRVRAPRGQAAKQAQAQPAASAKQPSKVFQAPPQTEPPQAEPEDDVPF